MEVGELALQVVEGEGEGVGARGGEGDAVRGELEEVVGFFEGGEGVQVVGEHGEHVGDAVLDCLEFLPVVEREGGHAGAVEGCYYGAVGLGDRLVGVVCEGRLLTPSVVSFVR